MPDTEDDSGGDGLAPRFDCPSCTDYEAEYGLDFTDLDALSYRSEFCEEVGEQVAY